MAKPTRPPHPVADRPPSTDVDRRTSRPEARAFDLERAWRLAPLVALRAEPFGALLYHTPSRRLSFLKDPALRDVVEALGSHRSARSAAAAAGLGDPLPRAIVVALGTLAATGMIIEEDVE